MNVKRITKASVLTVMALALFILELQIPLPIALPGIKLGLSNIVTVVSMFLLGPVDTGAILLVRILLGSLFSGQLMALLYSLAGGSLCYMIMLPLRRMLTKNQLWICSILSAIAHNIGQILVAMLVTKTSALIVYLPILTISSILSGLFTGLCAQFTLDKLKADIL